MPPVNAENDLKRRARRRLIGAVALALAAVIVVPLLLEDEPPPAGPLDVRMVPSPSVESSGSVPDAASEPIVAVVPSRPVGQALEESEGAAADQPGESPQAPPRKPAPPAPAPKPAAVKPVQAKPAPQKLASRPVTGAFVVQLAALKDAARANELKKRASRSGLPVYTDKSGGLTRVRVGPFAGREEAVAAAVRLAEIGLTGQILSQ